jgi:alpha-methylacyl-CoA racemase
MAGHDINYLAVSGVLSQLGRTDGTPYPPANILADFAGGGLACAIGIVMALFVRGQTGLGQVVETSMVDGAAYLGVLPRLGLKTALWSQPRGMNLLDARGCPYYDIYQCKCGGYMAVGAMETRFFVKLLAGLELDPRIASTREDRATWSGLKSLFTARFATKTRKDWEKIFLGQDACCTPVLTQTELELEGYEQRHITQLKGSPGVPIDQREAWKSDGLGPGVGGEQVLDEWVRWQRGRDYVVKGGGLVKFQPSKL